MTSRLSLYLSFGFFYSLINDVAALGLRCKVNSLFCRLRFDGFSAGWLLATALLSLGRLPIFNVLSNFFTQPGPSVIHCLSVKTSIILFYILGRTCPVPDWVNELHADDGSPLGSGLNTTSLPMLPSPPQREGCGSGTPSNNGKEWL